MRGSRNEPRQGLAAALAALLLLASAPPTRAQVGSPVPLIAQAPTAPASPAPEAPAAPTDVPSPPPPDESIKATPLAPVDAGWIGLPGAAAHPLPQTMWQGTPPALGAAALPRLAPTRPPLPPDPSRRLALTNARPPHRARPPGPP